MTENCRNIGQTMEQMYLDRGQTGDITFLVESQRIGAHRSVLAAHSPKYKAQFYGPNPDVGEIHVPHVSAAAFNVFLQFFYKKMVNLTTENIEMVLDLAKQSLVDEFVESCINFLIKANNLCVAYGLIDLYDIETLRLDCEQRISANTMGVFASDSFLQCDRYVLQRILKMDTLNCTENYVFHACIAWARVQCERDNLDAEKPENLRAVLGDVIYQIRFSSFSAEEFAALHKLMEGFFTADEAIELFYMTNKLKDFKPEKFNLNLRTSRNEPKALTEPLKAWSLEFNRFVRMNKLTAQIDVILSNFSFTCDDPIKLHGIALGIYFRNTDPANFPMNLSAGVGRNDVWLASFKSKYKVYQSSTRNNETIIIFEKPIEKITNFSCSIQLPYKRLNYEFDLHPTARVNDIFFRFEGGEWVTRLFFDKYEAHE